MCPAPVVNSSIGDRSAPLKIASTGGAGGEAADSDSLIGYVDPQWCRGLTQRARGSFKI